MFQGACQVTAAECIDDIDEALEGVSRLEARATRGDNIPDRIAAELRKDALTEIELLIVKYRTLNHLAMR